MFSIELGKILRFRNYAQNSILVSLLTYSLPFSSSMVFSTVLLHRRTAVAAASYNENLLTKVSPPGCLLSRTHFPLLSTYIPCPSPSPVHLQFDESTLYFSTTFGGRLTQQKLKNIWYRWPSDLSLTLKWRRKNHLTFRASQTLPTSYMKLLSVIYFHCKLQ